MFKIHLLFVKSLGKDLSHYQCFIISSYLFYFKKNAATTTTTSAPKVTGAAGDIPAVTNVKVQPKQYSESSAVVVSWDPPASKADLVDKYTVKYLSLIHI